MPYIVFMTVNRRISPGFSFDGCVADEDEAFEDYDTPPITNKLVLEALRMQEKDSSKKRVDDADDASDSSSDYHSADDERDQHYETFYLCSQNHELSNSSPVHVRILRQIGTPTGLKVGDPQGGTNPQVLSSQFLQNLSVKLCYLYYNIPGVCYQPAPILVILVDYPALSLAVLLIFGSLLQYAQKLAFFAANHLKEEASENLQNRLYFL